MSEVEKPRQIMPLFDFYRILLEDVGQIKLVPMEEPHQGLSFQHEGKWIFLIKTEDNKVEQGKTLIHETLHIYRNMYGLKTWGEAHRLIENTIEKETNLFYERHAADVNPIIDLLRQGIRPTFFALRLGLPEEL